MKDIVITSGTAVGSVLALAQAITDSRNCNVYVLCTNKNTSQIIRSSRFIKKVVCINSEDEKGYIAEVKSWYKEFGFKEKPLLYFTTDTSCFYIDNHREWFNTHFSLCMPSSEIIQTFTQKGLAEKKAVESGLIVPRTQVIKSNNDINIVMSSFQFPIILKPRATYLNEGLSFKIKVIQDKNDFELFATESIDMDKTLLCQEFIPGGNDTSYYYLFYRNKAGSLFESMGKKTLQSTSNGGIMLKGVSEFNKELSTICNSFLRRIDYQGIGGIEFKKYNNQFYFIEMSVRLEGFFKLSEISNIPLSLISYDDISIGNIPLEFSTIKQKDGYVYIDFINTFITNAKSKAFKAMFFDVFNIIFDAKVKLNVFSIKDFKPFLYQIINLFKRNK